MKILVDCTDIAFHGGNTGIRRVAHNLARHAVAVGDILHFDAHLVARFPAIGFVRLEDPSLEGLGQAVGAVRLLAYHGRTPRRFRRLCGTLFRPLGLQCWIERQWRGPGKLLLIAALLAPVYVATIVAMLVAPWLPPPDGAVEPEPGDVLTIPGSSWWGPQMRGIIPRLRRGGVHVVPLIHDLFPVTLPEVAREDLIDSFRGNIGPLLANSALVLANSRFTADQVEAYIRRNGIRPAPAVDVFRMGIELDLAESAAGLRDDLADFFARGPTFLAVGTVEPRKNYDVLLDAFELGERSGRPFQLVIAGKHGWKSERLRKRIESLTAAGFPLRWFKDLSDSELAWCYQNARALIYPSIAEGFGLPLLEALLQGCPVLASDLPVFREIGADHCRYFSPRDAESLARMVEQSLIDPPPRPQVKWPDWRESALEFFGKIRRHFQDGPAYTSRGQGCSDQSRRLFANSRVEKT